MIAYLTRAYIFRMFQCICWNFISKQLQYNVDHTWRARFIDATMLAMLWTRWQKSASFKHNAPSNVVPGMYVIIMMRFEEPSVPEAKDLLQICVVVHAWSERSATPQVCVEPSMPEVNEAKASQKQDQRQVAIKFQLMGKQVENVFHDTTLYLNS